MQWLSRIALAAAFVAGSAGAAETRLPGPESGAWRSLVFPKVKKHTNYEAVSEAGASVWRARAECSASAVYVPNETVDLRRTPILRWRWKLEQGVDVADERVKAGDDFAARVYVMFEFDEENAAWWEPAARALAGRWYGEVIPGKAINYVWAARAAVGSRWKNPYTDASEMIVQRTGRTEGWHAEQADIVADYRAAFGHEPPPLLSVAVMSDADNTCQKAVAYLADFRFTERESMGTGDR
jgi:hypothetical protein